MHITNDTPKAALISGIINSDSRAGAILQLTNEGIVQDYFNKFYQLLNDIDPVRIKLYGKNAFKDLQEHIEKLPNYSDHIRHLIVLHDLNGIQSHDVINLAKKEIDKFDFIVRKIKHIDFTEYESLDILETQSKIKSLRRLVNLAGKIIWGCKAWKRNGREKLILNIAG